MVRIAALLVLSLIPLAAAAQDENVHRELIRRQQQSDEFTQQLHQSLERAHVPPGDREARRRLETRQLEERQQLENLDAEQLRRAGDARPPFRPQQRDRMQEERRRLTAPPPADSDR